MSLTNIIQIGNKKVNCLGTGLMSNHNLKLNEICDFSFSRSSTIVLLWGPYSISEANLSVESIAQFSDVSRDLILERICFMSSNFLVLVDQILVNLCGFSVLVLTPFLLYLDSPISECHDFIRRIKVRIFVFDFKSLTFKFVST